jgi:DNA-binding MarR family transcriptional regulator
MGRKATASEIDKSRLQVLAELRYTLRQFLQFSEKAAAEFEIQPQQHQLLLQVAGAPEGVSPTIAYVAERLGVRHNSTVELVNRCEEAGLLMRRQDPVDLRRVVLGLTKKGGILLEKLSAHHAQELNVLAPRLIQSLKQFESRRPGRRNTEDLRGRRAWEAPSEI